MRARANTERPDIREIKQKSYVMGGAREVDWNFDKNKKANELEVGRHLSIAEFE